MIWLKVSSDPLPAPENDPWLPPCLIWIKSCGKFGFFHSVCSFFLHFERFPHSKEGQMTNPPFNGKNDGNCVEMGWMKNFDSFHEKRTNQMCPSVWLWKIVMLRVGHDLHELQCHSRASPSCRVTRVESIQLTRAWWPHGLTTSDRACSRTILLSLEYLYILY